jgi:glycosyltransferase involved in cell wall biosynthesis
MKIAIFGPIMPIRSGIAEYTAKLCEGLTKYAKIDLYVNQNTKDISFGSKYKNIEVIKYNHKKFMGQKYDLVIYQIGNNYPIHGYIIKALKNRPGIIDIHDYSLQDLFIYYYLGIMKDQEGYISLMKSHYGKEGEEIAKKVVGDISIIQEPSLLLRYPLLEEVLKYAKGIILHSCFVEKNVKHILKKVDILNKTIIAELESMEYESNAYSEWLSNEKTIPILKTNLFSYEIINSQKRDVLRRNLGFNAEDFVVSTIGHVVRNKNYDLVLSSIEALRNKKVKYLIIGEDSDNLLQKYKKNNNIKITGYVKEEEVDGFIDASDIFVNIRIPTLGETSASLIREMQHGKATIVNNVGWYSELPDYCVVKIQCEPSAKGILSRFIFELYEDKELRDSIGNEASKYISENYNNNKVVGQYYDFIVEVIKSVK